MVRLGLVPMEGMESEPLRAAQGGQNVGHVYHPVPGLSLPPLVGQVCTHLVDEAGVREPKFSLSLHHPICKMGITLLGPFRKEWNNGCDLPGMQ